jgi:hypothetical protein
MNPMQHFSWLSMVTLCCAIGCTSLDGPDGAPGLDGGGATAPDGDDGTGGDGTGGDDSTNPPPRECVPTTCAEAGKDCGYIEDGCLGFIDCGGCTEPEQCSINEPNLCGMGSGSAFECEEGLCEHRADCDGQGGPTTVTGTVYAPDGVTPLNNAVVYVPNDPNPANLPPIVEGASCERCEDEDLGDPITGAISRPDGSFSLSHVPAGVDFPLVVKAGKWRRVVMVSAIEPCATRALSAADTRLPRNQGEGHIPRIAVSTGQVDALECVLYKMGVDEGEFTRPSGDGRVHLYRSNGAWADEALLDTCSGCDNNACGIPFVAEFPAVCHQQLTRTLYGNQTRLDSYDMVFFGCDYPLNGWVRSGQWGSADHGRLRSYGDKGGRLFLSHYNYEWLSRSEAPQEFQNLADYSGGHSTGVSDPTPAWIDTSFARGVAFTQWLEHVGAAHTDPSAGHIHIHEPRTHIRHVNDPARRWTYTTQSDHNRDSVQSFTFDMPTGAASGETCGRGVYSAFHVVGGDIGGDTANSYFPQHCPGGPLTPQELALVFKMFDLAACVTEGDRPPPGVCTRATCEGAGAECGAMLDNCGGLLQCGGCPENHLCNPATNQCDFVG